MAIEKLARRAKMDGADDLVVTGHEEATHGAGTGTLILIPLVAYQTKLPIIVTEGFCDRKGLAAALILGADGISMGTQFMLTLECEMREKRKKLSLKATLEDTIYSDKINSLSGRFLKTPAALKMAIRRFHSFRDCPVPSRLIV